MEKFITTVFIICSFNVYSQNPAPAEVQDKRILFTNGTLHDGKGNVIEKSALGFENGKLKLVADITLIRINSNEFDTIINIDGKHLYPGLIALNTTLGLSEIEAVRATNDHTETGTLNPSARSLIAYNTDSRVIPTVRSNGVLFAQIVPKGGLISGLSSVVMLDAWNYQDATYSADIGLHLNWPSMRTLHSKDPESDEKQKKQTDKSLDEIYKLFSDAKAYASTDKPETMNLHLESMRGLFNGTRKLYVHCDYVKEIIAAAGLCREHNIKMVLVGGRDSWMVTDLLKLQDIPVVIVQTHRLPSREDEDIDMPYRLPAILKENGVKFAISIPGFWGVRNLPFEAGTSAGYGLTKEEALATITSSAAEILGIEKTAGALETGMDATFLICDGDLLEMKSALVESAFINGRQLNLDNLQKQLNRKYRSKYGLK